VFERSFAWRDEEPVAIDLGFEAVIARMYAQQAERMGESEQAVS
jgi:hypothetical protein